MAAGVHTKSFTRTYITALLFFFYSFICNSQTTGNNLSSHLQVNGYINCDTIKYNSVIKRNGLWKHPATL